MISSCGSCDMTLWVPVF